MTFGSEAFSEGEKTMKKILAIAAVAALTAGVSAYAANPFSDVSPDDWAYQAVSDLSVQGVVEGYPDGTFKGERNMTRYELAQIIARLMAREDQLNAEQRAMVERLAGEYADELANLGVRVTNLEKKVGNLKWGGDARMRWNQGYAKDAGGNLTGKTTDKWNGRMRIKATATINDSTYAVGRLHSDLNFKDGSSSDTYMDMLYIHHQFGDNFGMNIGRGYLYLGQTGLVMDDYFDGVQAYIGNEKLMLEGGYGRVVAWKRDSGINEEVSYARLVGKSGSIGYDAEYLTVAEGEKGTYIGGGLTIGLGDKMNLFGDYYQNTDKDGDPQIWTAGIGFGKYDMKKPGTFRLSAQYVEAEKDSYIGSTSTYVAFPANSITKNDVDFWLINADVILAKNVRLHGEYAFDVDAKDNSVDFEDLATVSLNYVF